MKPDDIPQDVWGAAEPIAAKVFNAYHDDDGGLGLGDPRAIVALAILAERERCAKIAEAQEVWLNSTNSTDPAHAFATGVDVTRGAIATAIRAGKE